MPGISRYRGMPTEPPKDSPEQLRSLASRARYHSLMINDRETSRRLKELAEELEAKAELLESESDNSSEPG